MTDASNTSATSDPQLLAEKAKKREKVRKVKDRLNEKVSDLAKEYNRLTNRFERALIEHKLAVDYFEFRSFWFDFLPVTVIAALITVIGFLISGKSTHNDDGELAQNAVEFEPLLTGDKSRQLWSLAVGILGAISSVLNAIGKRTNYQSQCDMHRSAVKALEKICLTVDFEKDWFHRNAKYVDEIAKKIVNNPEQRSEHEDVANKMGADLKSHQASFKAMQDACCESPVPTRVIQAFTVLDQIHGNGSCTATDLVLFYHRLWKEFSTYRWWPLKPPRVDVIKKHAEWRGWKVTKDTSKKEGESTPQGDGSVSNRTNGPNDDATHETIVAKPNSSDESTKLVSNYTPSYESLNVSSLKSDNLDDVCDKA
eukprot:scaffold11410_cov105-Skeletonema_dohrnii-CCMP3373.AAC.1